MFAKLIPPRGAPRPVRDRIVALYAILGVLNVGAWGWAFAVFGGHPTLLGTAFLAYVLGLRHAVDPDHIAAIDNVTRKLLDDGQTPVSVGLWFALGHSTIVVLAAAAIAIATTHLPLDGLKELGGTLGTAASAGFLLLIGITNLVIAGNVWRAFQRVRRTGRHEDETVEAAIGTGILARVLRPLFRLVSRPWHMYPLGFLFALGFDTATEVSLFGMSAVEAGKGAGFWSVLVYPALFTAGMAAVDATDGVLMLGAYGWAYVKPMRKLVYNLVITITSVVVALVIGGLEALHLIGSRLGLEGRFWSAIDRLNDDLTTMGFAVVALFATSWLVAWLVYRYADLDEPDVADEARV